MAQPIDERVLRAAQRAIANARGQEIFVEPVPETGCPSSSAKLYKVTNTAEIDPVKVDSRTAFDKKATAPQKPVKSHNSQRRNWLSGKTAEEAANVVVPRGVAADSLQSTQAFPAVPSEGKAEGRAEEKAAKRKAKETAKASKHAASRKGSVSDSPARASVPGDAAVEELKPDASVQHAVQEAEEAEVPHFSLKSMRSAYGSAVDARESAEECSVFLDHFFAQLKRCGVKNVVLSPGAQSEALALKANEHFSDIYVDSDERSAAFFALGLAKATGNVVVLIGSGSASAANWMPAVLEAEASRVPLLLLTADTTALTQGKNAAGVSDQLKFFGNHVKRFFQMPLPSKKRNYLSFAQQTALDACVACHGCLPNVASADAGPVHINFPFEGPQKTWACAREVPVQDFPASVFAGHGIMPVDAQGLFGMIAGKRVIAICGEGTCGSTADARQLLNFAHTRNVPLLADPLSGLRCFSDSMIIDHYDAILGSDNIPHAEVVIRFGRWPVSERLMEAVRYMGATQIVVDMRDCRDQTNSTDIFVHCAPTVFCEAMTQVDSYLRASRRACRDWQSLNDLASYRIRGIKLRDDVNDYEGAYIYEALENAPANSLVWCANGTGMLAVDTFYCKSDKRLRVMCNRGIAGIDGTISSALGAAQMFEQTTIITGDVAFLHDVNALALQNELRIRENGGSGKMPSVIIVLLNNCGAGSFEMLPQRADEKCHERLFLNPQSFDAKRLADGFGITSRTVTTVNTFRRTYTSLLGEPGINIVEILLPIAGMSERFADYQRI